MKHSNYRPKLLFIGLFLALAIFAGAILFQRGEEKLSTQGPASPEVHPPTPSQRAYNVSPAKRLDPSIEPLPWKSRDSIDQVGEALAYFDTDPEQGLAQLEQAMKNIDSSRMEEVLSLLTATLSMDDEEISPAAYGIVFKAWGRMDGKAALEYAMTNLPENTVRIDASVEAMKSWAQQDLASAAALVAGLPETFGKEDLIIELPSVYIEKDALGAMTWAAGLPPNHRENALLHSMIKWQELDPQAAQVYVSEFAKQNVNPIEGTAVLVSRATTHLMREDTSSALQWIDSLPKGWAQQEAKVAAADWWTDTDPAQASQWMLTLPLGPENDRVVEKFAEIASYIDPAAAADWATKITQDALRKNRISEILEVWAVTDAVASQNWARERGYSDLIE